MNSDYSVKSRLKVALVFTFILIFLFFLLDPLSDENIDSHSFYYTELTNNDQHYYSLDDEFTSLEQHFVLEELNRGVYSVSVLCESANELSGVFQIICDNDIVKEISASDCITNDSWLTITFDSVPYKFFTKDVAVRFISDAPMSNCFTFSSSTDTSSTLLVDGNKTNYCMVVRMRYSCSPLPYFIILGCIPLLVYLLIFLANGATVRTYLLISICAGLIFCLLISFPYQHIEASDSVPIFSVSDNAFMVNKEPLYNDSYGVWIASDSLNDITLSSFRSDTVSSDYSFFYSESPATRIPIPYYVSSFASLLCNWFGMNRLVTVLASRIWNLFLFILLTCFAIYFSDRYRSVVFAVSVSVLSFAIPSLVSVVPLFAGSVILFVSILAKYVLRYEDSDNISVGESILMLIALLFISVYPYLLLLPLAFTGRLLFVYSAPGNVFPLRDNKRFDVHTVLYAIFSALIVYGCIAWLVLILVNRNGLSGPVIQTSLDRLYSFVSDPVNTLHEFNLFTVNAASDSFKGVFVGNRVSDTLTVFRLLSCAVMLSLSCNVGYDAPDGSQSDLISEKHNSSSFIWLPVLSLVLSLLGMFVSGQPFSPSLLICPVTGAILMILVRFSFARLPSYESVTEKVLTYCSILTVLLSVTPFVL